MGKDGFDSILTALAWIIGIVTSLGIGGLFVAGTFTSTAILKWIPTIVHTVVGWTIISITLLGALMLVFRKIAKAI